MHFVFSNQVTNSRVGNQYLERDPDSRMQRTRKRPLPSGRVSPPQALVFSISLAVAGIAWLFVFVNALAAALVAASVLSYAFVYTPLKRRTWLATVIGAAPGALPILVGWSAAGEPLDARAWALFAILFLWQMPHFMAISWMYREDYARGGYVMLSVEDENGAAVARQAILYSLALLVVSVAPSILGLTGIVYLIGAVAGGVILLAATLRFFFDRSHRNARSVFMIFTERSMSSVG